MASSAEQWMVIRQNSSFLVKRRGVTMSRESRNLTNKNAFWMNGLVHKKSVGIKAGKNNRGVVVTHTKSKGSSKLNKARSVTVLKKMGPRQMFSKIDEIVANHYYRGDLQGAARRRASAILRSQRRAAKRANKKKLKLAKKSVA